MVGGLNELPLSAVFLEVGFDGRCCLVILCDIKRRIVSFFCQLSEDIIKCFDDGNILHIRDWDGNNVTGVIIVCYEKYCLPSSDIDGRTPVASVYSVPVCLLASAG